MKNRKDFSYRTFERKGVTLWGVYLGKKFLHTCCRTEEEAKATTDILNYDPYFFERQDWKQYMAQRT